MSIARGTQFGSYQVEEQIGSGGMGEVYRARDTQLGRDVAIKVLPSSFSNDAMRVARFEQEAKTLASLNRRISLISMGSSAATAAPASSWSWSTGSRGACRSAETSVTPCRSRRRGHTL